VPEWLAGRELATVHFKVYARRASRGPAAPRPLDMLRGERRWIAFERGSYDQKFDRWLATQVDEANVVLRVDNFAHAAELARTGLGIALLPTFVERNVPDLEPLTTAVAEMDTPMWLITHPELRSAARVLVMMRAFGPALANALRRAPA
jgi:DNA-binding transcriptional LysR family regulator